MADKLKLGYWKIRGLAQPIRFLLEYLAIPYEDKQYTIENHKEWFEQDKQNLNIFLPNLPYVIDGDFTLTESAAIQAYVIRKSGRVDLFGGADIKKSARVYQSTSVLKDLQTTLFDVLKQDDYKDQFHAKLEKFLVIISQQLGNKDWILGEITLTDFIAYEMLSYLSGAWSDEFKKFENLVNFRTRFEQIPQIKEYIASPRFIQAPFLPGPTFKWTGL